MSPLKPSRLEVSNGRIIAAGGRWRKVVDLSDIHAIRVEPVLSLCDEVGVTLTAADTSYFFTDADEWFRDVAHALDFDAKFGEGWHLRTEGGEVLTYEAP